MLLTGLNLFVSKRNESSFYLGLLGLFFVLTALSNGFFFLIKYGLINDFPYLYKTLMPFSFVIPLLGYWYIEKLLKQIPFFKWTDLLHLIPFFIVFCNYLPFYSMPLQEKELFVMAVVNDLQNIVKMDYGGFISEQTIWYLKVGYSWVYVSLSWNVFNKGSKAFASQNSKSKKISEWLKVFISIKTVYYVFLPAVYLFFLILGKDGISDGKSNEEVAANILFLATALIFFSLSIYLLLKPKLFITIESYKLPREIAVEYSFEDFEKRVIDSQVLNNPDLKINELAKSLQLKPQQITDIVNHSEFSNFRNFINDLRIRQMVLKVSKETYESKSLSGIASDYGFSSESTFYRAFKKTFNTTPQTYFDRTFNDKSND